MVGRPSVRRSMESTPTGGETLHHTDTNKLINKSINQSNYPTQKFKTGSKNDNRQERANKNRRRPEYVSSNAWNKFTEHLHKLGIQLNDTEREDCFMVLSDYCEFEQAKVVEQSIKKGWSCLQALNRDDSNTKQQ